MIIPNIWEKSVPNHQPASIFLHLYPFVGTKIDLLCGDNKPLINLPILSIHPPVHAPTYAWIYVRGCNNTHKYTSIYIYM